jgi:hypothetical protein
MKKLRALSSAVYNALAHASKQGQTTAAAGFTPKSEK